VAAIPDIIEFTTSPTWLGLEVSLPQETLLRSIYGLPLTEEQLQCYIACTGRTGYAGEPFSEVTVVAGRRSGKDSRIAAPVVLYEALFGGHEQKLHTGERGIIPVVAQDERGTRVAYNYLRDYVMGHRLLSKMVAEELKYELRLTNRMSILCFACTAKALRGYSIPAAVMDEVAFFRSESGATVDGEVQRAIRPAGASFPYQRLVKISTPSAKVGVIWDDYNAGFGKDNPDLLVWQAATRLMNPTISEERLAPEARRDLHNFTREYEALFSDETEGAIPGPWIEAAIIPHRVILPPVDGYHYLAAVDPSGGAADEFTLVILHVKDGRFVIDMVRGWAGSRHGRVNLAAVIHEIGDLIKPYGLARVVGDHYAGEWVAQEFRRANVLYVPFEGSSTDAYKETVPYFAQGRVELPDDAVLERQFRLLERRNRIGGKPPIITHPKNGHDDRSCAVAYGIASLGRSLSPATDLGHYARPGWEVGAPGSSPNVDPESRRLWRELRTDAPAASFWRGTETRPRGRFFG
jgi:hypothetical protein